MTVTTLNFLPKAHPITETFYKETVAEIIAHIQLDYKLNDTTLADLVFCSAETITNARNGHNKLSAHTLLNLLLVSPSAIEALLHHYHRRSAPIHQTHEADPLTAATNVAHKLAVASHHPSGHPNDIACLEMEADIDAAIEGMCTIKSRCINWRKAHAA